MFMTKIIEELLAWAEKNAFDADLTIEMLSEKSGYSKGHIQKAFKKKTGLTFCRYVKGRKLTRAAFMLKVTNSSIIYIVRELNFSSYQSFERAFRKQFRTSPLQYRKSKLWDMSSASPLLFLSQTPEHKYFYLPNILDIFDEPGNHVDAELHNFHSTFSILRKSAFELLTPPAKCIINFFKFNGSEIIENYTSIHSKTIIIEEACSIADILSTISHQSIDKSKMQLYAEFIYTGTIDDAQEFTRSIYAKSFPIKKVGVTERFFFETIEPIEDNDNIVKVKTYVPIFEVKRKL